MIDQSGTGTSGRHRRSVLLLTLLMGRVFGVVLAVTGGTALLLAGLYGLALARGWEIVASSPEMLLGIEASRDGVRVSAGGSWSIVSAVAGTAVVMLVIVQATMPRLLVSLGVTRRDVMIVMLALTLMAIAYTVVVGVLTSLVVALLTPGDSNLGALPSQLAVLVVGMATTTAIAFAVTALFLRWRPWVGWVVLGSIVVVLVLVFGVLELTVQMAPVSVAVLLGAMVVAYVMMMRRLPVP